MDAGSRLAPTFASHGLPMRSKLGSKTSFRSRSTTKNPSGPNCEESVHAALSWESCVVAGAEVEETSLVVASPRGAAGSAVGLERASAALRDGLVVTLRRIAARL